ncbi:hypothetical protein [Spirosoma endbachense]|uniref:Uncharacterized protein n=1 Tax=Spirosoma endbachense TaxID=2666025 RepID=A0A6P1VWT2_9BACT|nr:hypothetical protein [Spirosoma endbachense]QHV96290.1 hypothetical protein GJR95_15255 [Spirosoma endbachense]
MHIKVLTSCSGLNFSFHLDQVVREVDPVVGTDLVKHQLAIEVDDEGKSIVVIPEETDPDAENPDDSSEGSKADDSAENDLDDSTQETMNEETNQQQSDEEKVETATVAASGETAQVQTEKAAKSTGKSKTEAQPK